MCNELLANYNRILAMRSSVVAEPKPLSVCTCIYTQPTNKLAYQFHYTSDTDPRVIELRYCCSEADKPGILHIQSSRNSVASCAL